MVKMKRDLCRKTFHCVGVFFAACLMGIVLSATAYACENPDCVNYHNDGAKDPRETDCIECLYSNWDDDLKEYAMDVCEDYQVPYSMVNAIIWSESRYRANAVGENANGTQDWGLMQLNDVTFDFLSDAVGIDSMEDLLDPKTNIHAGVALLSYHRQWADNDTEMLMCYQMGQGAFARYKKSGGEVTQRASYVLAQGEYFTENCMPQPTKPTEPLGPRYRIIPLQEESAGKLVLLQA